MRSSTVARAGVPETAKLERRGIKDTISLIKTTMITFTRTFLTSWNRSNLLCFPTAHPLYYVHDDSPPFNHNKR